MPEPASPAAAARPSSHAPGAAFSERDRLLIAKAEQAIQEGIQIERWYREQEAGLKFFPLDLKNPYRLANRAEGFFGSLPINGQTRSAMGCRQEVDFGRYPGPNIGARLQEFVLAEFQKGANLISDQGVREGFEYRKHLHKHAAQGHQRFPAEARSEPVDWRHLGREHEWVLQEVEIHNFVVKMGRFQKRFRESAYVVPHADFVHLLQNPSANCALEVSIGYPFVDVAPHPNLFGFGPGKFGAAVKLFSFFLSPQNDLRVRMVFIAAPRAQKVLDFGKRIPDPVYGGAKLLHYLTLGWLNPQLIHDRMDAQMLALHCQVHQALMDGVEKVWRDWLKSNP